MDESTITILVSLFALGIVIIVFQWRQNVALEKRLRNHIRKFEERVRIDRIQMEKRLREHIQDLIIERHRVRDAVARRYKPRGQSVESAKIELRGEINAMEKRLTKRINTFETQLSNQLDTTVPISRRSSEKSAW